MVNGAAIAAAVASLLFGACRAQDRPAEFRYKGAGEPAKVSRKVTVSTADGQPIGLSTASSMCDGRLFVVDVRRATIIEFDLSEGLSRRTVGGRTPDLGSLNVPESVIADCDNGFLFVQDGKSVVQFGLASGAVIARYNRPSSAAPAMGFAVADGGSLVMPGYWGDLSSMRIQSPGRAHDGLALGYRLTPSGNTLAGASLLGGSNLGCRAMSSDCFDLSLDRRTDSKGWVACQGGGSTQLGLYSDDGRFEHAVDLRSPEFKDDGSVVAGSAPITQKMQWHQRNSAFRFCGAFGNYLLAVHYTLGPGDWQPGKAMEPVPLMNVFAADGTPLVSDLKLRDFPIAKDDRSLYVLVYGDARKNNGAPMLELDVIDILDQRNELTRDIQLRRENSRE